MLNTIRTLTAAFLLLTLGLMATAPRAHAQAAPFSGADYYALGQFMLGGLTDWMDQIEDDDLYLIAKALDQGDMSELDAIVSDDVYYFGLAYMNPDASILMQKNEDHFEWDDFYFGMRILMIEDEYLLDNLKSDNFYYFMKALLYKDAELLELIKQNESY